MAIEILTEEAFEGWAKFVVFALSLGFICGLVFLFMKVSAWKEKSGRKLRLIGLNRKQRREEQARKRRRRRS